LSLTRILDGLTHFAVLAFAAWTLVYDVGLAAHLGTTLLLVMWAACVAVIIAGLVRFRAAAVPQADPEEPARVTEPARVAEPLPVRRRALAVMRRALAVVGVVLGIGAGIAVWLHPQGLPWVWTPVLGLASAVAAAVWLLTGDTRRARTPAPGEAPLTGSVLAACVASAAAVFSLYLVRPTPDDVYYVSRSVWTAQHGRIPIRDILFTNQVIKPVPEPPISSIEVLDGALARMLGIPAAAFTYEIALPVLTFFAVWAVWLLIRRWAPGRYALCFIVAMVYLAWTGAGASFGAFHLGTMWEGKAAFVSAMVPLLYFYLTDWAENRTRRGLVLVIAAGVAAAGLSSAAVYVVPLITAAVAVPLLFNRMFKEAFGAARSAAYPLTAGLAVAVGVSHIPNARFIAPTVWTWVMKIGVVGAVGGVALWTAPWLARRGVPALITAGIAGLAGVLMVPGVIPLLGDRLGIGPVLWRLLWAVPGPVLAGLLAAVPLPSAERFRMTGRLLTLIPAGVLSAVLVVSGIPVWSHQNGATIASEPSWKVNAKLLNLARNIVDSDHSHGEILSTWEVMQVIPLLTTTIRAVNPRGFYLHGLPAASTQFIADRQLLTALADDHFPLPSETTLRAVLERVGVGYACVRNYNTSAIHRLETAGFTPAASFGLLECLQR
jgi:hypothetical protein